MFDVYIDVFNKTEERLTLNLYQLNSILYKFSLDFVFIRRFKNLLKKKLYILYLNLMFLMISLTTTKNN